MRMRIAQVWILVAVLFLANGTVLRAAELVMFESAACTWCKLWHEEIGPVYPKTAEAACAPLRRVDINAAWPKDLESIARVTFTPTFVVVENGQERARLVGYPGEEFFWPLLAERLAVLGDRCQH